MEDERKEIEEAMVPLLIEIRIKEKCVHLTSSDQGKSGMYLQESN
jgi:hypothetical protein